MGQRNGIEFSSGQLPIEILRVDMLSPFHLKRFRVFPASFRDIEPFVRKRAAHAAKHAAIDHVPDDASITPHADDVERNTGCFVPNNV